MRAREVNYKSEYQLIMEFIGIRNLVIIGLTSSIYLYSGFRNYYNGMSFVDSFLPYYVLHLNDGVRILGAMWDSFTAEVYIMWVMSMHNLALRLEDVRTYLLENVNPYFKLHPVWGFVIFSTAGFFVIMTSLFIVFFILKRSFYLVANGPVPFLRSNDPSVKLEEIGDFDPSKKPSDELLRQMRKNMDRVIQRARALGGNVPKNADASIRELAHRNKESKNNYRCAVYVMGPVRGTAFDNHYETPLTLDQIKKISHSMGLSAVYATIPVDLVILTSKKGTSEWTVEPSIPAISCGKSYPVKVLESVMIQNRNFFIWDNRASKAKTGYGPKHFLN